MAILLIDTPVSKLTMNLIGQRIAIPSIFSLTPGWESHLNLECHPYLETSILEWQEKYIASNKLRLINQRINLPLLTRMASPDTGLKELCEVGKWYSWLFAYDDAIDHDFFKEKHLELAVYRDEALKCARHSLLGENGVNYDPAGLAPNYSLAQGLYLIGSEVRQVVEQNVFRELICESICRFIDAAVDLGASSESGEVPDMDHYLAARMETSGVYPTTWISLVANHIDLPDWILRHELVREIMKHTNIMISLCVTTKLPCLPFWTNYRVLCILPRDNDILSFVKEFKHGHVENYVPILVHHKGLEAQSAIDETAALIHTSYLHFERLKDELFQLVPKEHETEISRLIKVCKDLRNGLGHWHYATPRYFANLKGQAQAITVTIEK